MAINYNFLCPECSQTIEKKVSMTERNNQVCEHCGTTLKVRMQIGWYLCCEEKYPIFSDINTQQYCEHCNSKLITRVGMDYQMRMVDSKFTNIPDFLE